MAKVNSFFIFSMLLTAGSLYSADSRLINGKVADKKDWPASMYASMSGSRCSATVVGAQTLFIASHCVKNGGSASFSVGQEKYTGKCTHAPGYSKNSTADWALCLIDKEVKNVLYEKINYDAGRFKVGDKLMLTGYGCIKAGGGGGNDGIFRIGEATIRSLPNKSNNDIVTRGGAALCYGDSGGAAYYIDNRDGRRWVVGVNSRGDISTTSYLPSVSTDESKDFLKTWAEKNNQAICGVHTSATGCR